MEPYQYGSVTVDDQAVRVGSESYSLERIGSVAIRVEKRTSTAWIFTAIVGIGLVVGGVGILKDGGGIPAIVVGVLLILLTGVLFWARDTTTNALVLVLLPLSAETPIARSMQAGDLDGLRSAIEQRIAGSRL